MSAGVVHPGVKCYQCEEAAGGVCRFCGAGVCQKHTKAQRYVTGVTFPADYFFGGTMTKSYDFVVVENARGAGVAPCAPTTTSDASALAGLRP